MTLEPGCCVLRMTQQPKSQQCCEAGHVAVLEFCLYLLSLKLQHVQFSKYTVCLHSPSTFACSCTLSILEPQICMRWSLHEVSIKEDLLKWMCSDVCTCAGPRIQNVLDLEVTSQTLLAYVYQGFVTRMRCFGRIPTETFVLSPQLLRHRQASL